MKKKAFFLYSCFLRFPILRFLFSFTNQNSKSGGLKFKLVFFVFFSVAVFSVCLQAKAYIPSYSMMLSHLAGAQGRGGYRIEQELVFKGVEQIVLREIWWVLSADQMRVDVMSAKQKKDMYLRFIYHRGKKIFRSESNLIQRRPLPRSHLEQPFHLRNASKLKKLFSLWKVAPFQVPDRKNNQGSDFFVRLDRKGGQVQYQIGKGKSRLWLEQDEFVIRSWKWGSGESLRAWDYKLYPGFMFFPSHRLFRHNSFEVFIQVRKIQSVKLKKKYFQQKLLSRKNTFSPDFSSADQDRIREFYKKFR